VGHMIGGAAGIIWAWRCATDASGAFDRQKIDAKTVCRGLVTHWIE
jgi:hypothetical protein